MDSIDILTEDIAYDEEEKKEGDVATNEVLEKLSTIIESLESVMGAIAGVDDKLVDKEDESEKDDEEEKETEETEETENEE